MCGVWRSGCWGRSARGLRARGVGLRDDQRFPIWLARAVRDRIYSASPDRASVAATSRKQSLREHHQSDGAGSFFDPFRALFSSYPGRFIMVAAVMFLNAMGGTPAGLLQAKYLQEDSRMDAGQCIDADFYRRRNRDFRQCGRRRSERSDREAFPRRDRCMLLAPAMWAVFFNSSGSIMVASWVVSLFAQTAGIDHPQCIQRGVVSDLASLDGGKRNRGGGNAGRFGRPDVGIVALCECSGIIGER